MLLIALSLMLSTPALAQESETEGGCSDGVDNDGDELIDCWDTEDCADDEYCAAETECDDEVDNDADGQTDCDDDDCAEDEACEAVETGDTSDTSDTADTADTAEEEATGSGAAELSGEEGGCGCQTASETSTAAAFGVLLLGLIALFRRKTILPKA